VIFVDFIFVSKNKGIDCCSAYRVLSYIDGTVAMSDRRKNQNYQALPHYLTDPLWCSVKDEPREKSQLKLFRHAWLLGLRCPSEMSFCVMDNVLRLHGPSESGRKASAFERYQEIGDMKKQWRKFKTCRASAGEDLTYAVYLEVLPREVRDLPAEFYLLAFQQDGPEPTRPWDGSLCSCCFVWIYALDRF